MKTAILIGIIIASGALLGAQEKPVPKDSVRVFIPGCAKGLVFTAGPRTEDQPGRSDVPPGAHFRLSGPKKVLNEIKAHKGTMIEVTGLIKKGQFEPGGIAVGGNVRIGGTMPMGNNAAKDPNFGQTVLDVEGWRAVNGTCPEK